MVVARVIVGCVEDSRERPAEPDPKSGPAMHWMSMDAIARQQLLMVDLTNIRVRVILEHELLR